MSCQDYLPSTTPRYDYEGIQRCLAIVEQMVERNEDGKGLSNPYFIINIDERSFLECFVNSEEKLLTLSWESYNHTSQFAILRVEHASNVVAAGAFETIFSAWARRVIDTPISSTNARPVRGHSVTKKADISWTPLDPPGGRSKKWPTLVGEVAWSGSQEARTKLEKDIRFWLEGSGDQVKVVLTITVHDRGRITIEKWDTIPVPQFPTQKIEIVDDPAPNCPRVNGQLQVPFRDVFLREKDKKDIEADFVLTENDMEQIARHVWAFQFR